MTLTNESPTFPARPLATLLDRVWLVLTRPWLALFVAVMLGVTILCALLLPQLPAQFIDDPIAAARWTSSHSRDYGALGSTLAGFGLFNAMNSVLWRVLSVALAFLLSLHLVKLWLLARQLHAVALAFALPTPDAGEPLSIPALLPVHRQRMVSQTLPEETFVRLVDACRHHFDEVQLSVPNQGELPAEHRCLAVRGRTALRLRLIGVIGGLLAMIALWLLNSYGWRVETPTLAPLDQFQDEWHQVQVIFAVDEGVPALRVGQSGTQHTLSVTNDELLRLGDIRATASTPALVIESLSPEAPLRRPEGAIVTKLGLSFPTLGREETVSLEEQAAVLRIVRRAPNQQSPSGYTIEVIQGEDQANERFVIDKAEIRSLRLGDQTIDLRFTPLASRVVEVRHLPGLWLLWPALALGIVGLLGLRNRPGFAVVQVAPWPTERSVIVVQSSNQTVVDTIF